MYLQIRGRRFIIGLYNRFPMVKDKPAIIQPRVGNDLSVGFKESEQKVFR